MKIINKLTLLLAGVLCLASCGKESDVYNNPTTATLPIEKKYQGNGTYAVDTTSFASNNDTIARLLVAHPSALASSAGQWPLVMVCNPSNTSGEDMMPIMRHLASWGFVVVGNMDQQTGTGRTMSLTLDEFLTLIETAGNTFNGKIDTIRIGIFGMSQGAFGTVKAVTQYANGSRYRVVYLGSCPQPDFGDNMGWGGGYSFADFSVPVLMLSGAGFIDANSISPFDKMQDNYEALPDGVPCAMARRKSKDHDKMGGEGDPYMTAWFCHWLLGDTGAAKAFCGTGAEMLQNERWIDAQIKNM